MKVFDHIQENAEDDFFATEQKDAIVKDLVDDEKRLDQLDTAIGTVKATVGVHTTLLEDWKPLIDILKRDYADVLGRSGKPDSQGT
jgi:hypothetical protein